MRINTYKFIVLLMLCVSLFGCRTVKKSFLEENYVSKESLSKVETQISNVKQSVEKQINESVKSQFSEFQSNISNKTSEKETENTTVSGSITAEDGKEKSVEIGNTKIKTNGANVTFESSSSKSISKEFESKFEQMTKQMETVLQVNEMQQKEIDASKIRELTQNQEIEALKKTQSKDVKKKGGTIGVWIWFLVAAIIIFILWRIGMFGKISKLFKKSTQNT